MLSDKNRMVYGTTYPMVSTYYRAYIAIPWILGTIGSFASMAILVRIAAGDSEERLYTKWRTFHKPSRIHNKENTVCVRNNTGLLYQNVTLSRFLRALHKLACKGTIAS